MTGWPRYHLNFTLIGSNLNCQQTTEKESLLVYSLKNQTDQCKRQNCDLYDITIQGDLELCHFSCMCFYSDPCALQLVFLDVEDEELCDISVPKEHYFKEFM